VQGPNDKGLSRKHIVEGTQAALKRLRVDYVDLIFCHRPDVTTPIEETVRAMNFVIEKVRTTRACLPCFLGRAQPALPVEAPTREPVRCATGLEAGAGFLFLGLCCSRSLMPSHLCWWPQGWAFYWGTSEWSAQQITEAWEVATRLGLMGPAMEQPEYNVFERQKVEQEYLPIYKAYGLGLTTWSPLASGVLSGKYSVENIPEGSRLSMPSYKASSPLTVPPLPCALCPGPLAAPLLPCPPCPASLALPWPLIPAVSWPGLPCIGLSCLACQLS